MREEEKEKRVVLPPNYIYIGQRKEGEIYLNVSFPSLFSSYNFIEYKFSVC